MAQYKLDHPLEKLKCSYYIQYKLEDSYINYRNGMHHIYRSVLWYDSSTGIEGNGYVHECSIVRTPDFKKICAIKPLK